jgi:hypothetical protein
VRVGWASVLLLAGAWGCTVNVAELKVAAARTPPEDVMRTAVYRGWGDGESCRFWVLAAHFGLPKVDEALDNALRPVNGAFMRDVTVLSVHAVYVFFGWHCYRVVGEVFG